MMKLDVLVSSIKCLKRTQQTNTTHLMFNCPVTQIKMIYGGLQKINELQWK